MRTCLCRLSLVLSPHLVVHELGQPPAVALEPQLRLDARLQACDQVIARCKRAAKSGKVQARGPVRQRASVRHSQVRCSPHQQHCLAAARAWAQRPARAKACTRARGRAFQHHHASGLRALACLSFPSIPSFPTPTKAHQQLLALVRLAHKVVGAGPQPLSHSFPALPSNLPPHHHQGAPAAPRAGTACAQSRWSRTTAPLPFLSCPSLQPSPTPPPRRTSSSSRWYGLRTKSLEPDRSPSPIPFLPFHTIFPHPHQGAPAAPRAGTACAQSRWSRTAAPRRCCRCRSWRSP